MEELVCKSIELIPEIGVKLPNGKAWIGDPCYVFPEDYWDNFCSLMFGDSHNPVVNDKDGAEVVVTVDGKDYKFWIIGTAFGDGNYALRKNGMEIGTGLGVDAGLLAVIPLDVLEAWDGKEDHLGTTILLQNATLTASEGNFQLKAKDGNYTVNTVGDDDDEDDFEDDYDTEDEDFDDDDGFDDEE